MSPPKRSFAGDMEGFAVRRGPSSRPTLQQRERAAQMARGALKGLKRARPAPGEKNIAKAQLQQGTAARPASQGQVGVQGVGVGSTGVGDLDGGDLVGWLNCECFFSLVLVGLLAALPFNLHTNELLQTHHSYVTHAAELYAEGAYEQAAVLYERAVSAEETPDGHLSLAETLVRVDRVDEALGHYGRAVEMFEDNQDKVSTLSSMGRIQREAGWPQLAVDSYLKVLELQPGMETQEIAEAHLQVASSLMDSGNYTGALAHFELATSMMPTLASAQIWWAQALRDMGRLDDAIWRYKRVIKQRNKDPTALLHMGLAYHEQGEFETALSAYKQTVAAAPPGKVNEAHYIVYALERQKLLQPARAFPSYCSAVFDLEARTHAFRSRLRDGGAIGGGGGGGGDGGVGGSCGGGGGGTLGEGQAAAAATAGESCRGAPATGGGNATVAAAAGAAEAVGTGVGVALRDAAQGSPDGGDGGGGGGVEGSGAQTQEGQAAAAAAAAAAGAASGARAETDGGSSSGAAGGGADGNVEMTSSAAGEGLGSDPPLSHFYQVHGLIFDGLASALREMIEAALGLGGGGGGPGPGPGHEELRWLDVLDVGCGRGAMGREIRHLANRLAGVDLSKLSLDRAKWLGMYDDLKHGDALVAAKGIVVRSMDLVTAVDTVPYFGELHELFQVLMPIVRPGGLFAFNAELLDSEPAAMGLEQGVGAAAAAPAAGSKPGKGKEGKGGKPSTAAGLSGSAAAARGGGRDGGGGGDGTGAWPFELQCTGRWRHRSAYVREVAQQAGFVIVDMGVVRGYTTLDCDPGGEGERQLPRLREERLPRETTLYLLQLRAGMDGQ